MQITGSNAQSPGFCRFNSVFNYSKRSSEGQGIFFKGLKHDRKDIEAVPNMKDCLQLSHTITTTWEFSVSV